MRIIVTTGQKKANILRPRAKAYAAELGCEFVERGNISLAGMRQAWAADVIIAARQSGAVAYTDSGELFFHLNMAQLRIKNLRAGIPDHMAEAMQLRAGMSVLDCTLGMGADAVMSSYISKTAVTALESSPVISLVIREGLKFFTAPDAAVGDALRRITVYNADYLAYLSRLPERSYDIVYIDPMFRRPVKESLHLQPLRSVADSRELAAAALQEAMRVAAKRVVVKEANHSSEFERWGIKRIVGGKYSSVAYGVIDCE